MKSFRLILAVTALCSPALSLQFNCFFLKLNSSLVWEEIYSGNCAVHHTTGNPIALVVVDAIHLPGFDNNDVESIFIQDFSQNLQQFPSNIDHFFPNLFDIVLVDSGLPTITAEDLKPFPALTRLVLNGNRILHVDGNLLQHTPNIRVVEFSNNQIETVGLGLFEGLRGFTEPGSLVSFFRNTCIDEFAGGPEQIAVLIQNLERDCLPPITTTTTTEAAVDECPLSCRTSIDSSFNEIEYLRQKVSTSESRIEQLEMQMQEILEKVQLKK
ncbi:CLUMA_CG004828, isoform A [Clunio marinus]|uniref:CLUMA_CG004828, isoform A n=1 Tax=Clunio marinus TaxID=568069 RepID=A0A1J1HX92_9DIPT|nr:CLUMA_CG004828, isoform A [Clunio marinus]